MQKILMLALLILAVTLAQGKDCNGDFKAIMHGNAVKGNIEAIGYLINSGTRILFFAKDGNDEKFVVLDKKTKSWKARAYILSPKSPTDKTSSSAVIAAYESATKDFLGSYWYQIKDVEDCSGRDISEIKEIKAILGGIPMDVEMGEGFENWDLCTCDVDGKKGVGRWSPNDDICRECDIPRTCDCEIDGKPGFGKTVALHCMFCQKLSVEQRIVKLEDQLLKIKQCCKEPASYEVSTSSLNGLSYLEKMSLICGTILLVASIYTLHSYRKTRGEQYASLLTTENV